MRDRYILSVNSYYIHKQDKFVVSVLSVNIAFDEITTLTLYRKDTKQEIGLSFTEFKNNFERV